MYYEKKAAREEGLEESRKELLKEMVLDGIISVEEAAKCLGVSVEDF